MSRALTLAAVDLGASSGRVVRGRVGPGTLQLCSVHRFRNGGVPLPEGLFWDVLGLYQDVLAGLRTADREAAQDGEPLAGVAIDSWAVDYGLLDAAGALLANPRHYRDERSAAGVQRVHAGLSREELYRVNGLQFQPFNTVYQLAAEPELAGRRALLLPDLLGYWLTGVQVAEETNASTTGLMDARTGRWSTDLLDRLGLPARLLAPLCPPGEVLGGLRRPVREELGLRADVPVSTIGSHDTASAVVGVPAQEEAFGYVSLGTWGLVGVELEAPVLSEAGRAANFTNERGVEGTVRYLRNVMGTWLLSESFRTWQRRGERVEEQALLAAAAELPDGGPTFDPDDPAFLPPGDMVTRIEQACRRADNPVPTSAPALVRCVLDSLALAFAAALEQAQELSGRRVEVVHVVGGGSRNELLCQLLADACGRQVIAGPVEATALGNLLVQARTHGALSGDRWSMRALARSVLDLRSYRPRSAPTSGGRR